MKEFKLALNLNEVNVILKALSALPYSQVNEIIAKIHAQAQEQITNAVITESHPAEKDLANK